VYVGFPTRRLFRATLMISAQSLWQSPPKEAPLLRIERRTQAEPVRIASEFIVETSYPSSADRRRPCVDRSFSEHFKSRA